MLTDRNRLAAGIFTTIMGQAHGLGEMEPQERKDLLALGADICLEAADIFIERANTPKT